VITRWKSALAALVLVLLGVLAACSGSDSNEPDCDAIAAALVSRIELRPSEATVNLGDSLQLAATAYSCAGALNGVTTFAWRSANASIATVSPTGLVKSVTSGGPVAVFAEAQGKQGSSAISTRPVPVERVTVEPATATVGVNRTSTLTVRAFDAQDREILGRPVTWSSANPAIVSVNQSGGITGVAPGGPAAVTATIEGKSDASQVTVVLVPVSTVTVAPTTATIAAGTTQQFTATLRDELGNVLAGRAVNWTSSDPTIATVTGAGGLAEGRRPGTVTITATSEGRSGSAQLTVNIGAPAKLAFVLQPVTVQVGSPMSQPVTVEVRDAADNRVPGATLPVTLALTSAPGGATLTGGGPVNAIDGVATFSGLVVSRDGTYSLTATSSPLTPAVSASFVVSPLPLVITTTTLPSGAVSSAYSQALAATGGTTPYTWAVATGTLPAGMTLNTAGVLSGTPTAAGTSSFTVRVTDAASRTATQALSLVVTPALSITTTTLPAGTAGGAYSQTLAATGGTTPYTWAVATGTLPAGLALSTGGVISGTPTATGTSNFTVRVTDAATRTSTQALSIVVGTGVTITTTTLPAGTFGRVYSQTLAATGGTTPYTWTLSADTLPAGLTLSAGGVISGTPTGTGTSSFTVQVTDAASRTDTQALSIVVGTGVTVTTTTLPAGTVGTAYSQTLAAGGGTTPYAWSVASGTLPAGVTLSAAGVLSGTPTAAGTSIFTVQVTDAASRTNTQALSIVVGTGVTITTTTLPAGTVGAAYSQTLAATGGTTPYTWSVASGTLPSGVTLSAAGALSGTPTAAGTSNFTVQVTDAASRTDTQALSIVVGTGVNITTTTLPAGTVGAAYSQALAATGGTTPYTWAVSAGTLPAGVTLSGAGVLSGTPVGAGTSTFTVEVTDAAARTDTQALTIVVGTGVNITTTTLPAGTVGAAYNQALAATGGTTPYTWSVALGTLPGGLTLSTGGVVSGTPTGTGTSNFTVQVTDAAFRTDTQALSIVVGAGGLATLSFVQQPTAEVAGVSIAPTVTVLASDAAANPVSGAPVTLSVVTGPAGATLNDASATTNASGVATFTELDATVAGTYTIRATSGAVQSAASNAFVISPAAAAALAIRTQPTGGTAGGLVTPTVQVEARDAFGNLATGFTSQVVLAVATGPVGGSLSNNSASAVGGIATFTGMTSSTAGAYTLAASATGLTGATTNSFTVASAVATQLVLTAVPTTGIAGQTLAAITVEARDAGGNLVTTFTGPVTLALGANPGGATITGTGPVNAVGGVATFSAVQISTAANGYTVVASSAGLASATSGSIDIAAAAVGGATQLGFSVQPSEVGRNAPITPAVQVEVRNASGARVTTATTSVTIVIAVNPGSSTLSGTLTRAAVNGVATFGNLQLDRAGTGYTLRATASGLTAATSTAFRVR
jgi:large repetitive protein